MLKGAWLKQCSIEFAENSGQYIGRIKNNVDALIEVMKYSTKIFTDPTAPKKSKGIVPTRKITPYVYVSAIDNIILAMSRHRLFDRFGFDLPKTDRKPGGKRTKLTDYTELKYDSHLFDWIDSDTEKALSGFVPSPILRAILESNMDKDTE